MDGQGGGGGDEGAQLGGIDKLIYDRRPCARYRTFSPARNIAGHSDGGRVPEVMHFIVDPATFRCNSPRGDTHPDDLSTRFDLSGVARASDHRLSRPRVHEPARAALQPRCRQQTMLITTLVIYESYLP